MELRVAVVEADEDFVGELFAHAVDRGVHLFQRREVDGLERGDVGGVDVPVFVAAFVLRVEDVLAVVGPAVAADVAGLVVGHLLGGGEVVDRRDPHVEDAVDRREVAEPLAVGADAGGRALGIAKQNAAGDQLRLHASSVLRRGGGVGSGGGGSG